MNSVTKYLNEILKLKTEFFVDIGCSDSTNNSQSEILLNHGWSGLMFEYDKQKFENQKNKMNGKNVRVINEKITPENILNILELNNCPKDFYLTIDIDGYDYFVLEKILSKYEPSLIVSEINEKIPPGIKFSVKYDKDYWWDVSHFYGYSLSMLEDLLSKHTYKILDLDYNNVVLVKGKQTESLKKIYNDGYLNRSDRKTIFHYNNDFEEVYHLSKEKQLTFLERKFEKYKDKYILL